MPSSCTVAVLLAAMLSGCIPVAASNLVIRNDPSCIPAIARALSAEGLKVSEGKSSVSFEGAPSSGVFGQVYEAPAAPIRVYFAERSFQYSEAALEQRQRVIDRIVPTCGPVTVEDL